MSKQLFPRRNDGDKASKALRGALEDKAIRFLEKGGERPTKPDGTPLSDEKVSELAGNALLRRK